MRMRHAQTAILVCCAVTMHAALLAGGVAKKELRGARISSQALSVYRANPKAEAIATGSFRISMSFARGTAKMPVARVTALCDCDGQLTVHNAFLCRPSTCTPLKQEEIMRAFKDAGGNVPEKERELACSNPAAFTPCLREVSCDAYMSAVYGATSGRTALFKLGRSAATPSILVWRIEVWQDGALATSWESSKAGLGKYALPGDWHAWKKYPLKFRYVAAH